MLSGCRALACRIRVQGLRGRERYDSGCGDGVRGVGMQTFKVLRSGHQM